MKIPDEWGWVSKAQEMPERAGGWGGGGAWSEYNTVKKNPYKNMWIKNTQAEIW